MWYIFSFLEFAYLAGNGQKIKFTIAGGFGMVTMHGHHIKFPLAGGSGGGSISGGGHGGGAGGAMGSMTVNGKTYHYTLKAGASKCK